MRKQGAREMGAGSKRQGPLATHGSRKSWGVNPCREDHTRAGFLLVVPVGQTGWWRGVFLRCSVVITSTVIGRSMLRAARSPWRWKRPPVLIDDRRPFDACNPF